MLVGVVGALAIFHKPKTEGDNIISYFKGSFQSPLIGILTFLYLLMISPIFPYVTKNQIIEVIPKKTKDTIPNLWMRVSIIYAFVWLSVNSLFIIFDTSPMKVISFISAVMAFYVTYFLPIFMTIKPGDYKEKID